MSRSATADLLHGLTPTRHRHSLEVARKAAHAGADLIDTRHLADLVTAAQLHDIGYRDDLRQTGFHPLDGAAALRSQGYSDLTCHLVAHHTGAIHEAHTRGIPDQAYGHYSYPEDIAAPLRAVLAWADLTTGPDGTTVKVEQRIAEILQRYPDPDPVHLNTLANRAWLLTAGQHPLGALESRERWERQTPKGRKPLPD